MAALTWRNVDAPDFRTSLEGYRGFADSFNNALNSARQGLREYDSELDKRANASFAMDLMKYQDPASYKAALASGQVFAGVNPNRISAANIQAANARAGELLSQKVQEMGITRDTYNFDRLQSRDAGRDAVRALLPAAQQAQREGKWAEFTAANPALNGLSYEDYTNLSDKAFSNEMTGVNIETGRLGMDNTRLNMARTRQQMSQDQTLFDRGTLDYNEGRQASDLISKFAHMGDGPADYEMILESPQYRALNLSGKVDMAIRSALLGSGLGTSGGGGGAGDPSRVMNYQAAAAGFSSVPASVKTLGDASDYAIQVNRAGVPSSAMGLYQIVGQTLRGKDGDNGYAKKAFGANWRSVPFTPENQDKIAAEIFKDNNGSAQALMNQWTSLSRAQAQALVGKDWSQARAIIARGESSATPDQLRFDTRSRQVELADVRGGMTGANPTATNYPKTALDDSDVNTVANSLTGKDGPFAGANKGTIINEVQRVARAAGVNFATAGEMLSNSIKGNAGSWWTAPFKDIASGRYGKFGQATIDDDLLNAEIARAKSGDLVRSAVVNQGSADVQATLQSAQANYEQARAAYTAKMLRQQVKPGIPIEREAQALELARRQLDAIQERAGALSQGGRPGAQAREAAEEQQTFQRRGQGFGAFAQPLTVVPPAQVIRAAPSRSRAPTVQYTGPLSTADSRYTRKAMWDRALGR